MHGKRLKQRGEAEDQQDIGDIRSESGADRQIGLPMQGSGGGNNHFRQTGTDADYCHANNQGGIPSIRQSIEAA